MSGRPGAADPVGDAVADALRDMLFGASVEIAYTLRGSEPPPVEKRPGTAAATGPCPGGRQATVVVRLGERAARLISPGTPSSLGELLDTLPGAALRAVDQLRTATDDDRPAAPALRRAVRDTLAAEVLGSYLAARLGAPASGHLVAETVEYLIELSGTRVEAHGLTHGVVVSDVLDHPPRIPLHYPEDLRAVKRAPLLFDGRRSVLVVDPQGCARTELQRHRLGRLGGEPTLAPTSDGWSDSGSLVAEVTRVIGGVGFYVRADRTIWTFVDGQPLVVRRGEHWTAFPLELAAAIANMIGGGRAAALVARAAFTISAQPHGAILAIVDEPGAVDDVVSLKDRYDLRGDIDPSARRPETRLHHLIDAEDLDEHTLARLATLDGATILDRDGNLVAYGAIVTTADSEHEGARTAAARTLSETAIVVLKVSVDGDITVFQSGALVTTLLGHPAHVERGGAARDHGDA
ncbi:MAG TPA: diadenylate cyclase [Acidimicrobiales bacterium]|nr:diadenylate cyclase [Acidimicrobiales bacterium]